MNKIILSCVPLLFLACVEPTLLQKTTENETIPISSDPQATAQNIKIAENEINPITKPDPQAMILHTCLIENKYLSKRKKCLNKNKFKIATIIIEPQHKSKLIGITRGDDTIKTLNLQGKDIILLHINSYGVNSIFTIPKKGKVIGNGNIKTIIINVKDIKDKIIIKDEKENILIEYKTIR